LERLAKRNYIPKGVAARYQEAFLREYKRHIGASTADAPAEGLEIKVLGPGCPQCERLEQEVMTVLAESGIAAELTHVRDPAEIGRYGVMGTPALVVNGSRQGRRCGSHQVKAQGLDRSGRHATQPDWREVIWKSRYWDLAAPSASRPKKWSRKRWPRRG
jgi:hypothetical protein